MKWLNDEEEQFEFYDVAVRFPNGVQDYTGFVIRLRGQPPNVREIQGIPYSSLFEDSLQEEDSWVQGVRAKGLGFGF